MVWQAALAAGGSIEHMNQARQSRRPLPLEPIGRFRSAEHQIAVFPVMGQLAGQRRQGLRLRGRHPGERLLIAPARQHRAIACRIQRAVGECQTSLAGIETEIARLLGEGIEMTVLPAKQPERLVAG